MAVYQIPQSIKCQIENWLQEYEPEGIDGEIIDTVEDYYDGDYTIEFTVRSFSHNDGDYGWVHERNEIVNAIAYNEDGDEFETDYFD